MNNPQSEELLNAFHKGELRGINTCLVLINNCIVHSEKENKNFVDGDKLIKELKTLKEISARCKDNAF